NIPGMRVVKGQIPGVKGATPANLLGSYSLRVGAEGTALPADQPFSFTVTKDLFVRVFRTGGRENEGWSTQIPLLAGASTFPLPKNFSMPPLNLAGALQRIHGPFSGNSDRTKIRVNSFPVRLLAESPRGVYCLIPGDLPPGPVEWIVNDSGHNAHLRSWVLGLQMSADKLKLMKGESTAFHVVIRGVETIPQEAWFGSGEVPEFIDPGQIRRFLPDFNPPSPSQPGVLVLTLENMSTGTVIMSGGDKLAFTFGYGQGKYEHHGTITAKQAGSFTVDGTLIPFLHDQPEIPGDTSITVDNGRTPPVNVPSPTPTPVASTEKKKKEEDCPQRGKGCVALVIDFSHNVTWEFDMESLSKKLTSAGCDTDYVTPDLQEIPLPHTYGYEGVASYTSTPDPKDVAAAREHNTPEWKKVRDAIAKHREKVAKGVELAIEIVNAHGAEQHTGELLACGNWEWKEYTGDYLYRAEFHSGNYRAANKNVCGWFTSDFSCYGGLTPKVVDELNNLTTATCSQASAIACPNHAGWEADSSTSSATNTETCSNGSVGWQKSYIGDPLDEAIAKKKDLPAGSPSDYSELIGALRSKAGESSTSRYADRGYAKDKPPSHAHGGYGEGPGK
ncbi:MAG TPA: hypothetical protein VFF39_06380, partial [Verrucomicrobiae bacterium]|nr:hypothetical protein [Verrucomicrobiae bacterium]